MDETAKPRRLDDVTLLRVLKALAHPKRFRMVQEIAAAGELSCGALCGCVEMPQPTGSHHLKILCDAGVVEVRREAQHGYLSVNHALVREVLRFLPRRLAAPPPRSARRSIG